MAGLTRLVRDLAAAEDLAHDALVAALQQWPTEGIPRNPGAWLMAAGKRRAIDALRRRTRWARKHEELARDLEAGRPDGVSDIESAMDDDIGDDLLRLVFTACHPVLPTEARTALTLRLLGGLTTDEIARAFLVPEPTIAQRIVRAKRALARARVPFEVPRGPERDARLSSVLEVVYLIFNEGYSATAGDDWVRPALCDDAVRLGRVLAGLAPGEPEVHGLVALMELQSSRLRARVGPSGEAVRLLEQDRARWDQLLIGRGLAALRRAETLGGEPGPYQLQAAVAACHARARVPGDTDWARVARLYARLIERTGSPIVRLNHAVAVGMAEGPAAGLALVDALIDGPRARVVPLRAERPWRPAGEARSRRRGTGRVRSRGGPDEERARARPARGPGPGLRDRNGRTAPPRAEGRMSPGEPYGVRPIGWVRSRLARRLDAPKQGHEGAPDALVEVLPEFAAGLGGLSAGQDVLLLTWLHEAERAVLEVHPRDDPGRPLAGVFSTRSADRPNPVGLHPARLLAIVDGRWLHVSGLEAIDGTPVIDIKPVLS